MPLFSFFTDTAQTAEILNQIADDVGVVVGDSVSLFSQAQKSNVKQMESSR